MKKQKQNQNNTHDSAADEAAVTEVADDAAPASSAALFPSALETVDQSCQCVTAEEDRTEGHPESLGILEFRNLLFFLPPFSLVCLRLRIPVFKTRPEDG